MKFTSKQVEYQSKRNPYPTFINSYVRDGKIDIGEKKDYLSIGYSFCHEITETVIVDGVEEEQQKEVIISKTELRFTESHQPTYMTLSNGEKMEVYEAILTGETYSKDKIADEDWGKPDLHKVMTMFELSSLTNTETGLVIKTLDHVIVQGNEIPITPEQAQQIKQLMIDWISQAVYVENEKLGVNFEFETQE